MRKHDQEKDNLKFFHFFICFWCSAWKKSKRFQSCFHFLLDFFLTYYFGLTRYLFKANSSFLYREPITKSIIHCSGQGVMQCSDLWRVLFLRWVVISILIGGYSDTHPYPVKGGGGGSRGIHYPPTHTPSMGEGAGVKYIFARPSFTESFLFWKNILQ